MPTLRQVQLDRALYCLVVDGQTLALTPHEYAILEALEDARGAVVRSRTLRALGWGDNWYGDDSALYVYVMRLRHKIEIDPQHPTRLLTVRGFGYRLI